MTQRENLLSLLRRQGYTDVPVEFTLSPHLEGVYRQKTGATVPYAEYFGFPWRPVEDLRLPPFDRERYRPYFQPPLAPDGSIDEWGVGHEPSPNSMHMTYLRSPMKHFTTVEEIEAYPFPDYAHADASHQKPQADAIKAQGLAALGNMQMTIWEAAWYLRGMENLMMDMMTDDEMAHVLLRRVTDIAVHRAKSYARAGVDILFLGDDIGMQSTPMMSEELYVEWLKPALGEVIAAAKAVNPQLLVFYHSCGFVEPFIPHLIDAGVDVLNPIQSESMDFAKIHAQYGDRLSFQGTIGTQTVMPFGTPEEVRQAVWQGLDIAGPQGGLWAAPTHMLEPEVPWENVLAYVQACRDYKPKG